MKRASAVTLGGPITWHEHKTKGSQNLERTNNKGIPKNQGIPKIQTPTNSPQQTPN